jgi:hypothetical protein
MNQDQRNELRNKHHLIEQPPISGNCRHCDTWNDEHGIRLNDNNEIVSWECIVDGQYAGTFFSSDSIGWCAICVEMDEEDYPCEVIQVLDAWEATL